jgi:hypothetical protein
VIDVSKLTITQALVALAVEREPSIRVCELKKKIPLASRTVERCLAYLIRAKKLVRIVDDVPKYSPFTAGITAPLTTKTPAQVSGDDRQQTAVFFCCLPSANCRL